MKACVYAYSATSIDEDPEEEKKEVEALGEQYKPLIDYMKEFAKDTVNDGTTNRFISHSLTSNFSLLSRHYYSSRQERLCDRGRPIWLLC